MPFREALPPSSKKSAQRAEEQMRIETMAATTDRRSVGHNFANGSQHPCGRESRRRITRRPAMRWRFWVTQSNILPMSSFTRADRFLRTTGNYKRYELLMALNRQIYFECPVVPSLSERLLAFVILARRDPRRCNPALSIRGWFIGWVGAYCPKISTAKSTSQASPIVCQYHAVASTAIWRDSTRLNQPSAERQKAVPGCQGPDGRHAGR